MTGQQQPTEVISIRFPAADAAILRQQAAQNYRPVGQYLRLQIQKSLGTLPLPNEAHHDQPAA